MTAPYKLSLSALGPFSLTLDEKPVPKFKYLDSRELLVYLAHETTPDHTGQARGKTKQEIGAALWGDLSDTQLNARFKARLNDVRRVLGNKSWILFEDETYKFNALHPIRFDVAEFQQLCKTAESLRRVGDTASERQTFQQAIAFLRGEFMQDYHTRRSRRDQRDPDEREWYLQMRQELAALHHRAANRLAQLELENANFEPALALLRKLVAADPYDDDAHYQLMLALALQGKRSQALRHYQLLAQTRADTPPDSALTTLYEKIKRGENLSVAAPNQTAAIEPSSSTAAFQPAAPVPPPFQLPADLPRFVGRAVQFESLRAALHADDANRRHCLVGMGGIGKTSLAVHTAYLLRQHFTDGVLWGNLRESTPLAILASWERAFGCDFSGLPDLNARAASFRSLVNDKKLLVIVDDVVDVADARALLLSGAHTRMVFTSRSAEVAAALDAQVIEMPVLDAAESADLLTLVLGTARVAGQADYAQQICQLLGHLPLALDITAHRLVSRPHWTLSEMAERLRAQMQRLDELQLADRAVRATFALSWDALNAAYHHILAHVGAFSARSFTVPALASVANVDELTARETLDALVALSLLSFEGATRYRQHPLLADFSLEKLAAVPDTAVKTAHARIAHYYLDFATAQRRNYLALEDEWDNLNVGIEIAHTQALWREVIDYGDILTDAWFARGRFTDARRNYGFVKRAARELEEQDPYIAASLNWGKACIDQGDYAEAEEHLQHGLQTSREVSDEYNIANALFLLGRVSVERSEYDQAGKYLEESQGIRERLDDKVGVAETLYMRGRIKYLFHEYAAANTLLLRALELEGEQRDRKTITILRVIAINTSYLNEFERSEGYNQRALVMADAIKDYGEKAATLLGMSIVFWRKHDLKQAISYAAQCLPLFKQMGDRKAETYTLEQLSKCAAADLDYASALDTGNRSLSLARDLSDANSILRILSHLGDVYVELGEASHACEMWSEALTLAVQFQHPLTTSLQSKLERHSPQGVNFRG